MEQKIQTIIYPLKSSGGKVSIFLQNGTFWLTQQQMADLFQTTKQNISLHIKNIFEEGELEEIATVKKYLTVRKEGKRNVKRNLSYYHLDMIISVGYRVKSSIATKFRIWAAQQLIDSARLQTSYLNHSKIDELQNELIETQGQLKNHLTKLTLKQIA